MSKVAIMTDSNSGITQDKAEELGISVLPMPFMIDGETFLEGVSLTHEQFYEKLEAGADISTSQPSPESVMDMWRELLKDHDEIVHIPMSSGLSGSCQTALMLAGEDEFEGKVHVVNNQRISVTQKRSVLDAISLAKEGKTGAQIKDILEEDKFNSSIYIMLDTLYYLKKGGRITPAAAALGTLLKLKPVLQIQGEKLDAFAKARTKNQGKSIMITAMENDIKNRFGVILEEGVEPDVHIQMAYTKDLEAANAFKAEVAEKFPASEIDMDPLSLSIACHIGPGALAVAVTKKLK